MVTWCVLACESVFLRLKSWFWGSRNIINEMPGQAGQCSEQPGVMEGIPAHGRQWSWMSFKFCDAMKCIKIMCMVELAVYGDFTTLVIWCSLLPSREKMVDQLVGSISPSCLLSVLWRRQELVGQWASHWEVKEIQNKCRNKTQWNGRLRPSLQVGGKNCSMLVCQNMQVLHLPQTCVSTQQVV